jgi:GLPGLI family protein
LNIFKKISLISAFIAVSIVLSTQIGCNVLGDKSEGIIVYDITYPKPHPESSTQSMMPSEMEFQFKDDKYINDLSIMGGVISIKYIVDNQKKELVEYAKIISSKYAAKIDLATLPTLLKDVPVHTVKLVEGETKEIAGYTCKKAIVTVADKVPYSFDVYYTTDIALTDPNWCTPFKDIPGTLMEYQIEKFNVIMRFTAKEVKNLEQDAKEFSMPEGVEYTTPQVIDAELKEMQE